MIKKLLFFLSLLFIINISQAQLKTKKIKKNRCYTVEIINQKKKLNPNIISTDAFEQWLSPLVKKRKQSRLAVANYTLAVVFHVIHNNETLGSGRNVSKAAIEAQLLQLNKDFANLSGSPYAAATNSGIQFALATRNPSGGTLAEAGIDRISITSKSWDTAPYSTDYVDATIKPNSIWDPTKYVNIWITDVSIDGVLGYATFPGSSTLNGLDNSETSSDAGVVIDYTTVGSIFSSADCGVTNEYGMGKTLTHEVGHFLGLRHIWGDQDPAPCSDDFCGDTPLHYDANYGKPSHPKSNSCGTQDEMFENYMDYCDDIILNTFTADQVDRMQTVLLNSPRRNTLATSNVGFTAPVGSNKIALAICSGILEVSETGNTGSTNRYKDIPLTLNVENVATGNATVNFNVSGSAVNNIDYQLSATSVSFSAGDAAKTIILRVLDNAKTDGDRTVFLTYTISGTGVTAANNGQNITITIKDDDAVVISENPVNILYEDFENSASVSSWSTLSSAGAVNVFTVSANGNAGGSGNAAHITSNTTSRPNNYNVTAAGVSVLRSPLINTSGLSNLRLKFKYRVFGEADEDGIYDYGMVLYTPASEPTDFQTSNSLGGPYYGETSVQSGNPTLTSINQLTGTSFYLGFYWKNDNNLGASPGLNIDDVELWADATKVETAVNNSYAYGLAGSSSVENYFRSISSGKIIATVKNASTTVLNVAASITEAGTDRLNITSGSNNYLRSRKVIKIVPATTDNTTQFIATLYFTTNEMSVWGSNSTSLKVLKIQDGTNLASNLNASNAVLLTPTIVDKRTTDGYISYTVTSTGFGSFILVESATILPLTFTQFAGKLLNNSVQLQWSTSNEVNTQSFIVEKSVDGGNTFTSIGSVAAKTANSSNDYSFIDAQVVKGNRYYYRIKQMDIDGKYSYSAVINVLYVNSNQSVSVLPNPFYKQLILNNQLSGNIVSVTVTDINGKQLYYRNSLPTGTITIDTYTWSKGMYFVRINSAATVNVFKVIKE